MKLDERRWVVGGGLTPEWRWVHEARRRETKKGVADCLERLAKDAPASARARRYRAALRRLDFEHPALDYWLWLWRNHFARPAAEEDWHLQLGLAGHFAAGAAYARGPALECDATLDPDGRFFLHGTPLYLEFPGRGRAPVRVSARKGRVSVRGEGFAAEQSAARRLDEVVPGIVVDDRGWLQLHGVVMHGHEPLDDEPRAKFAATLRRALEDMKERDPALHAEMTDLLTVLTPLKTNPQHSSVSSSYVNIRGLIGLSHADDPLLQAETLIHEFCHMKMNQLLSADPVLLPGQSGQVFYSPWRADARRLRGLLLGAHAFLNVARYLARSLEREKRAEADEIEVMVNVSRRVLQVEDALRGLLEHASFTEFGRRFVLAMWSELGLVRHATLWYPEALLAEQRAACAAHRARHALGDTALHKDARLLDKIARPAFLAPKQESPS